MTIADLAYVAQMDWSYLTQLELGKKNPSLDVMDALAHAVGIQLRDLLDESVTVNSALDTNESALESKDRVEKL